MALALQAHDRPLRWLLLGYAIAVLLLVSISTRLWWQSPLDLIDHEFDYFLGMFAATGDEHSWQWRTRGQGLHFIGCLIVGLLYFAVVDRLLRNPRSLSNRTLVSCSVVVSFGFAVGMPWVSPDVFFYIGKGWAESHYGASPYLAPISSLPGYQHDQMFANIFPGFLHTATGYGPIFQKISEVIAGFSGGNEKLALALHKLVNLGLHGASSLLVYRLAPPSFARVAAFSYAINPLVCFSVLTCAHNDQWMNMFMLVALLALLRRHWAWTGVALGAAFGIKYFPLVYVPIIGLAALVQVGEGRPLAKPLADAVKFSLGFSLTVAASFYLFYPEAVSHFATTLGSGGVPVYRNSIYHVIELMTAVVLPASLGTAELILQHLQALGAGLRVLYVVMYAVMLLAMLRRIRQDTFTGSVEACLMATILYFMVANTSNQEWYLTWLIGLALVLPYAHAHALVWRLTAYFLPLVIYTVKSNFLMGLLSNSVLYLLVLGLGIHYFWRSRQRPEAGGPAVVDQRRGFA